MNIDPFALRAFIELARRLHFGQTATALHVSPSRLTRAVQGLEREVGTPLLIRSTHAVQLTPAGAEFLRSARRITAELDWVGHRFARNRMASSGTFTVGCLAGTLYDALPARIRAARQAHPQLRIRLVELPEDEVTAQVTAGALDMGFLYFPSADDALASRVVARRAQWVAMSLDHPLAARERLRLRDLAGEVLILPDEAAAPRLHRWYRSFLAPRAGRDPAPVRAQQIHVALGLCAAGEGLCVVAENLRQVRSGDICYRPLTDAPRTELTALWRQDSPMRPVAQFIAKW
jgi:DNA-binding transcriptional LysR family regulator